MKSRQVNEMNVRRDNRINGSVRMKIQLLLINVINDFSNLAFSQNIFVII